MRSLIARHGAIATVVPSMREVALESNTAVFAFAESLLASRFDVLVFLTGVGARMLVEVAETRFDRNTLLDAMRRTTIAARGPKPAAVLREWNVPIAIRAAEPNTWRELVEALESAGAIVSRRIAVQEYGRANSELYAELTRRGASVEPVPVYRWMLPEDLTPLRAAIDDTIAGKFDILLFTSAQQVDSVLEVAAGDGKKEAWLKAAYRCEIASIGPTASEALRDFGLPIDIEANPTRMGQLVRAAIEAAPAILESKGR
jgi:uroporphyrinogen-III synthase